MMTDERRMMLLGLNPSELVEMIGKAETGVARLMDERNELRARIDVLETAVRFAGLKMGAWGRVDDGAQLLNSVFDAATPEAK